MWDTLISGAGLLLTVAGAFIAWTTARRSELRRSEVLAWVNEAIACFQTTTLLSHPQWFPMPEEQRNEQMRDESIKASILIEQGRMFFRNRPFGLFGNEKEPAYRGIRPLVLDELVVLHGLARDWPNLDSARRLLAFEIAVASLKRFVSMAQQEVGRERSASAYAAAAGNGISFGDLLSGLERGRPMPRPVIEDTRNRDRPRRVIRWLRRLTTGRRQPPS